MCGFELERERRAVEVVFIAYGWGFERRWELPVVRVGEGEGSGCVCAIVEDTERVVRLSLFHVAEFGC